MEIQQQVDLVHFNSFAVSQTAAYFAEIECLEDLQVALAFAQEHNLPRQILGAGSNTLFINDYPGLILHMNCKGIERLSAADQGAVRVKAACGENWHELVRFCVKNKLHGIENLALIPGTVGAAPIQNIGAYGVELDQLFVELEALDTDSGEVIVMSKADCEFSYRHSLFKQDASQSLIVLSVTLELATNFAPKLDYQGLRQVLGESEPSAQQLFDAICEIRSSKLPDPQQLGNAGSFFKNPLISTEKYQSLKQQYPEMPAYQNEEEGTVKLPAAWLLEQTGAKSKSRGDAAVHSEHALVLVNRGSASGEDLLLLAQELSNDVLQSFGIALQVEVRIV